MQRNHPQMQLHKRSIGKHRYVYKKVNSLSTALKHYDVCMYVFLMYKRVYTLALFLKPAELCLENGMISESNAYAYMYTLCKKLLAGCCHFAF